MLLVIVVTIVVLAAGTGTGIGLRKRQSSSTPAPSGIATPTETATSTIPTISVTPVGSALNDSSMSAVLTPEGDRHLFFQDVNGTLRHAIFSKSSDSWLANIDWISVQRLPKNHTPISALQTVQPFGVPGFNVFYTDINNTVAAVQWSPQGSSHFDPSAIINSSFDSGQGSRSISVCRLSTNASQSNSAAPPPAVSTKPVNTIDEALLLFETATRDITVLHGIIVFEQVVASNGVPYTNSYGWSWNNVTELFSSATLESAGLPWVDIIAPFSVLNNGVVPIAGVFSIANAIGGSKIYTVGICSVQNASGILSEHQSSRVDCSPAVINAVELILAIGDVLQIPDSDLGEPPLSFPYNQTDLISFEFSEEVAFVRNNSLYICKDACSPLPDFPLGRFAALSTGATTYLYHQLNESVFLEEIHDNSLGVDGWTNSSTIVVPKQ